MEKPSVTPTSPNKAVQSSNIPTALNQVATRDAAGSLLITSAVNTDDKTGANAVVLHNGAKAGAMVRVKEDGQKTPAKSISPQKLAANRRNAQLSTGPRTEEGKSRSRVNAVKHGILSFAVVTEGKRAEDPAEFDELLGGLWRDLAPVGTLEEMLVEKIAVCWWRQRRALKSEAWLVGRASRAETKERQLTESRDFGPVLGPGLGAELGRVNTNA